MFDNVRIRYKKEDMKNLSKEELWNVLGGKYSVRDMLLMSGVDGDKLDLAMDDINRGGIVGMWSYGMTMRSVAYRELVNIGELSADKIFNPNSLSKKEGFDLESYEGDVGFKGSEVYRCMKRGNEDAVWEKCF